MAGYRVLTLLIQLQIVHIFCYDCDNPGLPTENGMYVIENVKTGFDNEDHVLATTPLGFSIRKSTIPNAGLGAFAETTIPKNTRLGPYDGVLFKTQPMNYDWTYMWQIIYSRSSARVKHYVDALPKDKSSWIRYVNCARTIDEENLYVYQYNYEIYYVTYECIKPGTELLVWYGDDYGQILGLHRTKEDYMRRFNETGARRIFKNSITEVQPQQYSSNCYQFFDGCPFRKPPGSVKNYTVSCLPTKQFTVCKYSLCDKNPCTNQYDCRPCQGYCFHAGTYVAPNQEILHFDNVNICSCSDLNKLTCTDDFSTAKDMCIY